MMLIVKYNFEVPRDNEGKELKDTRWTKKQREECMTNVRGQASSLEHAPNV